MEREVEKALECSGFSYKGSKDRDNGDEITIWLCPDNETVIEVITLESEETAFEEHYCFDCKMDIQVDEKGNCENCGKYCKEE